MGRKKTAETTGTFVPIDRAALEKSPAFFRPCGTKFLLWPCYPPINRVGYCLSPSGLGRCFGFTSHFPIIARLRKKSREVAKMSLCPPFRFLTSSCRAVAAAERRRIGFLVSGFVFIYNAPRIARPGGMCLTTTATNLRKTACFCKKSVSQATRMSPRWRADGSGKWLICQTLILLKIKYSDVTRRPSLA
jgi:hypothetical protein